MSETSASARDVLGTDHPLVRADEAIIAVKRQALVCAVFLLATVAAAYPDVARATSLVASAAAVDLALLGLVALLRRKRRLHARDVIIEGGPLHLPYVRAEMRRLADERHRAKLTRRLHRAVDDAEGWHSLLVASRPPVGILKLV